MEDEWTGAFYDLCIIRLLHGLGIDEKPLI